ncbi:osteoclast-stimulating factor 1-like [Styela clava]
MSSKSRPPPPRLAPKPGMVKTFRALYPYEAQQKDELSIDEGDIIYVTDQSDSNWWKATCKGKSGLVPSNYMSEDSAGAIDFPLHEAAKRGNLDFLRESLRNRVGINGQDKSGSTALYWAAHSGHGEVADELVQNSLTDLNSQNKLGDTALHAAAWKGHDEIVRLLLERGANPLLQNNDKKTPFDLASSPVGASLLKPKKCNSLGSLSDDYLGDGDESD